MDTSELFPWKCTQCQRINKKVATHCAVCTVHWTTGVRHQTEPKQQTYQATAYRDAWPTTRRFDWEQWEEWEADDKSWSWQMPLDGAQSRSHSQSTHNSQSPRGRKGKGSGKTKKKGKTKMTESQQSEGKGAGSLSTSPFAPLAPEMPIWTNTEASTGSNTPFATTTFNPNTAEQLAQKKECVAALRAAYPDGNTIPSETKDLIDKMDKDIEKIEKENNKFVTKNIHSATKSLGKAQKALTETLEAKKAHRTRWIKHITEAVTTWQEQLKEYQKQQASLQEVITKAKEDIELARSAIQTLSSTASQAMLASMPPITPVTAEQEDGATEADKEEEKLQGQLQTVLQDCAAVLTRECTTPTLDVEDLTMDDAERDKKRQRSMEPFGGSTKS